MAQATATKPSITKIAVRRENGFVKPLSGSLIGTMIIFAIMTICNLLLSFQFRSYIGIVLCDALLIGLLTMVFIYGHHTIIVSSSTMDVPLSEKQKKYNLKYSKIYRYEVDEEYKAKQDEIKLTKQAKKNAKKSKTSNQKTIKEKETETKKKKIIPLEEDRTKKFFCSACNIKIDKHTKHCKRCNKCVDRFDHHCNYLNNCIGRYNYELFWKLLFYAFLYGIFCLIVSAYSFSLIVNGINDESILKNKKVLFLPYAAICVLSAILLILSICICSLVGQLYVFHYSLRKEHITTYEYIQREKVMDETGKRDPIEKAATAKCPCLSKNMAVCAFKCLCVNEVKKILAKEEEKKKQEQKSQEEFTLADMQSKQKIDAQENKGPIISEENKTVLNTKQKNNENISTPTTLASTSSYKQQTPLQSAKEKQNKYVSNKKNSALVAVTLSVHSTPITTKNQKRKGKKYAKKDLETGSLTTTKKMNFGLPALSWFDETLVDSTPTPIYDTTPTYNGFKREINTNINETPSLIKSNKMNNNLQQNVTNSDNSLKKNKDLIEKTNDRNASSPSSNSDLPKNSEIIKEPRIIKVGNSSYSIQKVTDNEIEIEILNNKQSTSNLNIPNLSFDQESPERIFTTVSRTNTSSITISMPETNNDNFNNNKQNTPTTYNSNSNINSPKFNKNNEDVNINDLVTVTDIDESDAIVSDNMSQDINSLNPTKSMLAWATKFAQSSRMASPNTDNLAISRTQINNNKELNLDNEEESGDRCKSTPVSRHITVYPSREKTTSSLTKLRISKETDKDIENKKFGSIINDSNIQNTSDFTNITDCYNDEPEVHIENIN